MEIPAENRLPIAEPVRMRTLRFPPHSLDAAQTMASDRQPNTKAFMATAEYPRKENPAPNVPPPQSMASAAPKAAPFDTPSV